MHYLVHYLALSNTLFCSDLCLTGHCSPEVKCDSINQRPLSPSPFFHFILFFNQHSATYIHTHTIRRCAHGAVLILSLTTFSGSHLAKTVTFISSIPKKKTCSDVILLILLLIFTETYIKNSSKTFFLYSYSSQIYLHYNTTPKHRKHNDDETTHVNSIVCIVFVPIIHRPFRQQPMRLLLPIFFYSYLPLVIYRTRTHTVRAPLTAEK